MDNPFFEDNAWFWYDEFGGVWGPYDTQEQAEVDLQEHWDELDAQEADTQ